MNINHLTNRKIPQIFIDAARNWPEDEASLLADTYKGRLDEDPDWAKEVLPRDIAHMYKVFNTEVDGKELIARFDAELRKLGVLT